MNKGRPKTTIKKTQINLTIEKEILKLMKKYSVDKKKSLSQITEELYTSLLNDERLSKENPEELLMKIKLAMPIIEKMVKQKKEEKPK